MPRTPDAPRRSQQAAAATTRRPKRDAQRTRRDILAVARSEFAERGLSGARVDAIAARTRTTKAMIYYYFGSKEGLYSAVLEQAYSDIRNIEMELNLESLGAADAIRRLVSFTFDYDEAHPNFIRLVAIENIHNAENLARSKVARQENLTVIRTLDELLARGRRSGVFRSDITATDLHFMISAFCFFRIANRHSFQALFNCDLMEAKTRARHKRLIIDAVIRMLEPLGRRRVSAGRA